jgi:hypothetical protein
VDDDVKTELEEAAAMFVAAPQRLRAAIVEAGKRGETTVEIAKTINFAYNPDYIGKIINRAIGDRKPGRRPKRTPPEHSPDS